MKQIGRYARMNILGVSILFVASLKLQACLVFEKKEYVIDAEFGQKYAKQRFDFINDSAHVVRILDIKTSCSCTVSEVSSRKLEPGERGYVLGRFDFGDRIGHQVKHIVLYTDCEGPNPLELTMTVDIPEAFDVRPRLLLWKRGGDLEAQYVHLKALVPQAHISKVEPRDLMSNLTFATKLNETEEGGEYRLQVTPLNLRTRMTGVVRITIETDEGEQHVDIQLLVK